METIDLGVQCAFGVERRKASFRFAFEAFIENRLWRKIFYNGVSV